MLPCSLQSYCKIAKKDKKTKRSTGCEKHKKLELQPEGKGLFLKYYSVYAYCKSAHLRDKAVYRESNYTPLQSSILLQGSKKYRKKKTFFQM
jgi:hypothetical protein